MKIVEEGAFKGLDIDMYCKIATFKEHQIFLGLIIESFKKPEGERFFSPRMLPASVGHMLVTCGATELYT